MRFLRYRFRRHLAWCLLGFLVVSISVIPLRLAIASEQAPKPQIIFTLGGGEDREKFTAEFAKLYPKLEVWFSAGDSIEETREVLLKSGIPKERIYLDQYATDTVTNFTTIVTAFKKHSIQHIYLLTSAFHMPRAKVIGTLILGSQGIKFTPVSIYSKKKQEPFYKILRDAARSILWIISGRTGASFNPNL
jgi:uncharacterized SAM-binding protein YcdF (DUF218 family)